MKIYEGNLDGKKIKAAIVVSRFNEFITSKLLGGALDCLKRHGVDENDIAVAWVPGAFEVPGVAKKLVESKKYDTVICLGAVIRGETPHFEYVSAESAKGIASVGLSAGIPVIYGILTTDTVEQSLDRAGAKTGNKGWDAAMNAIETVNLYRSIGK